MPGAKGRSGRKRKPTSQHIADGTFEKGRHADRIDNSPTEGWPEKPAGLSAMQDRLWSDVVTYLPPDCLGTLDTSSLRDMVRLYGVYTDLLSLVENDPTDDKALNSMVKAFDRFWKYAQDYGLTPIARARMEVPKKSKNDSDPMADLSKLIESRN